MSRFKLEHAGKVPNGRHSSKPTDLQLLQNSVVEKLPKASKFNQKRTDLLRNEEWEPVKVPKDQVDVMLHLHFS